MKIESTDPHSTHVRMGNMASVRSGNRCDGVSRFGQRFEGSDVGNRPGNRLYVYKIAIEHSLGRTDTQRLDGIKIITPLVVPLSRQALRISAV